MDKQNFWKFNNNSSGHFMFSKKESTYIKGIALILMFTSHLFAFPEWLGAGNNFVSIPLYNNTIAYLIGKFGDVCIGIFMFLIGYGMYYSYQNGNAFLISGRKVIKFLLKYWILLFTFFLPIQLMMGRTYFNPTKWHQELFGIYTSIVGFAWYVRFYVLTMLTLPALINTIGNNVFISAAFSIIPFQVIALLLRILSTKITFHNTEAITAEYFKYISVVLFGYCFAKFELFDKLNTLLSKYRADSIFTYIIGIILIFVLRLKFYGETNIYLPNMDIIYVPILLFCTIKIIRNIKAELILKCLGCIGKNSMNLWFLQSVFFFETNNLQWIIYLPRISFLVLICNIIILLPISELYNIIYKKLHIF